MRRLIDPCDDSSTPPPSTHATTIDHGFGRNLGNNEKKVGAREQQHEDIRVVVGLTNQYKYRWSIARAINLAIVSLRTGFPAGWWPDCIVLLLLFDDKKESPKPFYFILWFYFCLGNTTTTTEKP